MIYKRNIISNRDCEKEVVTTRCKALERTCHRLKAGLDMLVVNSPLESNRIPALKDLRARFILELRWYRVFYVLRFILRIFFIKEEITWII